VDYIDQSVAIGRDLVAIYLILDAAASGDPIFAAIERIVAPSMNRSWSSGTTTHGVWRPLQSGEK
jgi:hypothetical protein